MLCNVENEISEHILQSLGGRCFDQQTIPPYNFVGVVDFKVTSNRKSIFFVYFLKLSYGIYRIFAHLFLVERAVLVCLALLLYVFLIFQMFSLVFLGTPNAYSRQRLELGFSTRSLANGPGPFAPSPPRASRPGNRAREIAPNFCFLTFQNPEIRGHLLNSSFR